MIWLTWRQFRAQAWAASTALALLAVILAVTGVSLAHAYDTSGILACHTDRDCASIAANFLNSVKSDTTDAVLFYAGVILMYVVPAVMGVFWGAPLVTRELEAGTHRLAWNQGVTRTRWLVVKLGVLGVAAMAVAGLLSLMVSLWADPIQRAGAFTQPGPGGSGVNWFAPTMFGARGVAVIGYAAFAFALGVAAGVLVRRTVPAMAITLAAFAAVQVVWPLWVRAHLIKPLTTSAPFNAANIDMLMVRGNGVMTVQAAANMPGAWVISNVTTRASGQPFTGPAPTACGQGGPEACQAALGKLHLRQLITYQPASRYWDFQWLEMGIFVVFAVALAGFCLWRIRSRRVV